MNAKCLDCRKFEIDELGIYCRSYTDTSWVDRRGGCPIRHLELIKANVRVRVGQQKQRKVRR